MPAPFTCPRPVIAGPGLLSGLLLGLCCGLAPLGAQPPVTSASPASEERAAATAAETEAVDEEEPSPWTLPVSRDRFEAFLDGYMAAYLEDADVAGAAVAVVSGDRAVLERGYGFADVEARVPVDPRETLFRIGSVSKLFVWTAIMQLAERGELELDVDVNRYLGDLQVPEAFGSPVTLETLMAHTSGLDERVIGLFGRDETTLGPLGQLLLDELPPRVREPGDLISYSNHGTALAMYVVEQVTGQSWRSWIDDQLLEPLEMDSTSFEQPLPPELAERLSKGYVFADGRFVERPFEFVPLAPVGAAASSASDMARLLRAYLGGGTVDDRRILRAETLRTMQAPLFEPLPEINGMAHGFMELDRNGVRVLGHGGDTELFHTLFAFFPEHDFGVFASFNSAGADWTRFYAEIVDFLFPPAPGEVTTATVPLDSFAGHYRPTRYSHRDFTRLVALLSTFEVEAADGYLVTHAGERREWLPIGPGLFRERGSSVQMGFRQDARGRNTHLFFDDMPVIGFERVPPMERPGLVLPLFAIGLGVLGAALALRIIAFVARRVYLVRLERSERVPLLARWPAHLSSVLLLVFFGGLALSLGDPMSIAYGITAGLETLLRLPLLSLILTIVALVVLVLAWARGLGRIWARLGLSVVVLAQLAILWQLWVWRLLLGGQ